MSIVIDDPKAEDLLQKYAAARSLAPQAALIKALEDAMQDEQVSEKAEKTDPEFGSEAWLGKIREIQRSVTRIPGVDSRALLKDLYDEAGLPI